MHITFAHDTKALTQLIPTAIYQCPRYHPREQQFRLRTLLESCEAAHDDWLAEYVMRMRQHEAKVGSLFDCLSTLESRKDDESFKLIPAALQRAPNEQVTIAIDKERLVVSALRELVNYDGRLAQSEELRDLRKSALPGGVGADAIGDFDSADAAVAAGAPALTSGSITLPIENLISAMYATPPVFHTQDRVNANSPSLFL